jgi:toxin-antitoxin system PIN domain toxin
MILLDANLLIYAYHQGSEWHPPARRWLTKVLEEEAIVALPWGVLLAFLRLSTNQRVFSSPYSSREATDIVASWLERPNVVALQPGEAYWHILRELICETRAAADLIADAHLAALAIEHSATLCSTDRDFARFPGLKFLNPLAVRSH